MQPIKFYHTKRILSIIGFFVPLIIGRSYWDVNGDTRAAKLDACVTLLQS
jgi:hypothetical protein